MLLYEDLTHIRSQKKKKPWREFHFKKEIEVTEPNMSSTVTPNTSDLSMHPNLNSHISTISYPDGHTPCSGVGGPGRGLKQQEWADW